MAALVLMFAACAQTPAQFTTMLDTTNGLGPGDPVTRGGSTIGQVLQVTPSSDGGSDVTFQIAGSDVSSVRTGSLLLLSQPGSPPALELSSTDPTAPSAIPGSFIAGASNDAQAEMLLAARGTPALSSEYQRLFNSMSANGTPASSTANDMLALWQAAIADAASSAAGISHPSMSPQEQIAKLQRDGKAVERELLREGQFQDAARVHQQVELLTRGMSASLPQPAPAPLPGMPH